MLIQQLESWYQKNHRKLPFRSRPNPYWIWISEIMLQQTQMDTVIPYFLRFIKQFPTIQSIAEAEEEKVLTFVQGLGYYRRFRLLKKAAEWMMQHHQGKFPNTFEDIENLPGVGSYTAGAIASIAFGLPKSAVDGNVLRVIARYAGIQEDITLQATKKKIMALNQQWIEQANPPIYTQALMELGALVCRPKAPQCEQCPLQTSCYAYAHQLVETLPKVAKKKRQVIEPFTTVLFLYQGKLGFQKRQSGLLEGMYLFPQWQDEGIDVILKKENIHPQHLSQLGKVAHIFTHKRWEMSVFLAEIQTLPTLDLVWIPVAKIDQIPIAKAHRKLLDHYKIE